MATAQHTLFSDLLTQLDVPHTEQYANAQFAAMPFQTLFGLSKLLDTYGIDNESYQLADKGELQQLTPPFLADTPQGWVIVTGVTPTEVSYLSQGEPETATVADFDSAWNGIVLLAFPTAKSAEPDYARHKLMEMVGQIKTWFLWMGVAALFAYVVIHNRIYAHWATVALTVMNIVGLLLTFMLVQKTLKIKNKAADRVCGVLEEGGCDSILELKASSFFGIFKWSEVGFAYFSVSLVALLVFPQSLPWLALCNACCLPFTLWSIWYQKFRAKVWCTLCVSVQATLWVLFFCYLLGGCFHGQFPFHMGLVLLVISYAVVLLALNKFDTSKLESNETDTPTQP